MESDNSQSPGGQLHGHSETIDFLQGRLAGTTRKPVCVCVLGCLCSWRWYFGFVLFLFFYWTAAQLTGS